MENQNQKKKVPVKKTAKPKASKVTKKNVAVFSNKMIGVKTDKKKKVEPKKEEKKVDKIFGNDFNTGNIDPERFPDIQIDSSYASSILDDCYNMEDYMEKKKLLELTVETFKKSQWGNLPLDKKFSKELQPFIFHDLYKGIDGQGFTTIDKFICIAEFMDISYERVYEIAGLKMKEHLINELEDKYKMLSKKHINRLFGVLLPMLFGYIIYAQEISHSL
jgi:hypothetical protein